MKLLSTFAFAALTGAASAATIFSPGDPIAGGQLNGGTFNLGAEGCCDSPVNQWPGAEAPGDMINGIIGGGGEKYLNFAKTNTGIVVTPTAGGGLPSVVTSMELWVADDANERDPASYQLFGSNAAINLGADIALSDFTLISEGGLALPLDRDNTNDATGFSQVVSIDNSNAYSSYMLVFPTIRNEGATNSMQLSEVQLEGTFVPEPSTTLVALLGLLPLLRRRRG